MIQAEECRARPSDTGVQASAHLVQVEGTLKINSDSSCF